MTQALRPQYHLRPSPAGLLAWDVRRLIALSAALPVIDIPLARIAELDTAHWYLPEGVPTCRSVAAHCALILAADDRHPIILDVQGRVMDGMHRVCKRLLAGQATIPAVQFENDPEPDFVGVQPDDLPYESWAV